MDGLRFLEMFHVKHWGRFAALGHACGAVGIGTWAVLAGIPEG